MKTNGISLVNITDNVTEAVRNSDIKQGLLNISVLHTSASIIIQENASYDVTRDMLHFFDQLVPMTTQYEHDSEGVDDMPAHIKSALTSNHLCLSINKRKLVLGKWQGIFLFEHRLVPKTRQVSLHAIGN